MQKQKAHRYQIQFFVKKIELDAKFPCKVSVQWTRGKKVAQTSTVQLKNGQANLQQVLSIPVNFFIDPTTNQYISKKTVFTLFIHTASGSRMAGSTNFDPSERLSGFQVARNQLFRFERCPDPNAKFLGTFSHRYLGQIQWDKISNKSGQTPLSKCNFNQQILQVRPIEYNRIHKQQVRSPFLLQAQQQNLGVYRPHSLGHSSAQLRQFRSPCCPPQRVLFQEARTRSVQKLNQNSSLIRESLQIQKANMRQSMQRLQQQRRVMINEKEVLRLRSQNLQKQLMVKHSQYTARVQSLQQDLNHCHQQELNRQAIAAKAAQTIRILQSQRLQLVDKLNNINFNQSAKITQLTKKLQEANLTLKRFQVRDQLITTELNSANELNNKLNRDKKQLQQRVKDSQNKLKYSLEENNRTLQSQLGQKQRTIKQLMSKLTEQSNRYQVLQVNFNGLSKKLKKSQQDAVIRSQQSRSKEDIYKRDLDMHIFNIRQQYQNKINSLARQLSELQHREKCCLSSIQSYEQQRNSLLSSLRQCQGQNKSNFQASLMRCEERNKRLQCQLEQLKVKSNDYIQSLFGKLQLLYSQQFYDSSSLALNLQAKVQRFQRLLAFLKSKRDFDKNSANQKNHLKAQNSRLRASFIELQQHISRKQLQLSESNIKIKELKNYNQNMLNQFERELQNCAKINQNLKEEYNMLLNELSRQNGLISELKTREDSLSSLLSIQKNSRSQLQQKNIFMTLEIQAHSKLKHEQASFQQFRSKSASQISILTSKLKQSQDRVRELQTQVTVLRREKQLGVQQANRSRDQLFAKQNQIIQLSQQLKFVRVPMSKEQQQQYRSKVSRLQIDLQSQRQQVSQFKRIIAIRSNSDPSQLIALRSRIAEMQQEIIRLQQLVFDYSSRQNELIAREQDSQLRYSLRSQQLEFSRLKNI